MIHSKKMKFAVTTAAATAIVCTGALAANVTSTTDVNVRSGAGNSYSVLTVMKSGTTTASLGNSGKWTKVNVNGKTGYVYSKYLTSGGNTSSTPSNNGSQNVSKTVYISASSLNVRSGAGTSYSVIGNLKKGNSASVVGSTNGWYKIKYGSGYGYISSAYTADATSTNTSNQEEEEMVESTPHVINGVKKNLNAITKDGITYVSLRELCAALGLKLSYDSNTEERIVELNNVEIKMDDNTINVPGAFVNQDTHLAAVGPMLREMGYDVGCAEAYKIMAALPNTGEEAVLGAK